ncbi:MAG: ribosome maturation factor RimP [Syntrophobacterales bacterium]|jgi:ribosome maturation factor RimP|nr:ribosome maturation factor RimP [Syntrophobacterales bacterium]
MISENEIVKKIESVLNPILGEESIELVDLEFMPFGKRWMLRIFIDKEGGVTIADCETVNRELGRILDVEDFIDHPYTLEVSSPGLTRSLKKRTDFLRYRGKLCKITTKERIDNKTEFRGKIVDITDDKVEIKGKIDVFTIPICAIKKANLEFEL